MIFVRISNGLPPCTFDPAIQGSRSNSWSGCPWEEGDQPFHSTIRSRYEGEMRVCVYFNTLYLSLWSTSPSHPERRLIAFRTLICLFVLSKLSSGIHFVWLLQLHIYGVRSASPIPGLALISVLINSPMPKSDPLPRVVGRRTRR